MSNTPNPRQAAPSRRAAERETRRKFILDAARALHDGKGVTNTSMDDLAAAAGYTRRTLYAYFTSRDDLLLHLHEEDLAQRWESQQEALMGVEGGLARIRVWAQALHAFWKGNSRAMELERYWDFHTLDRDRFSAEVFESFEALNRELADGLRLIFAGGIEDGSLRPDLKVDVCISQFLYSLRAILGRALSSAYSYSFTDIDPDAYVAHFLDLYLRSVRNEG
ncbi:MAG: helix-turn-helix transcriptional regulator [bacterium]|nr:helix-turn-helix transcriptional regulator [bacterium]